ISDLAAKHLGSMVQRRLCICVRSEVAVSQPGAQVDGLAGELENAIVGSRQLRDQLLKSIADIGPELAAQMLDFGLLLGQQFALTIASPHTVLRGEKPPPSVLQLGNSRVNLLYNTGDG